MRDRLGGLFAKAASRATEGAERLREAAGRAPILQHAQAARERGNQEAAFWLLDEAFRTEPTDREAGAAFWEVAVALGRGARAAEAGVALVEFNAAEGQPDAAARHFAALVGQVPEARVSPAAVARMLPPLCARIVAGAGGEADEARELARVALAHALQEDEDGAPALSPGLAIHLFKEARKVDDAAARRTAEIALTSPDLHEVKRAELEQFLAEGGGGSAGAAPARTLPAGARPRPDVAPPGSDVAPEDSQPTLEVDPDDSQPELEIDEAELQIGDAELQIGEAELEADDAELEIDDAELDLVSIEELDADEPVLPPLSQDEVVDAARRLVDRHDSLSTDPVPPPETEGLHVMRAVPVDFEEQGLVLQLPGGRASRVGWQEIQALAVVRIGPDQDDSAVVLDCILNWRRRQHEPLRLLRFHADDFVIGDFVGGESPNLSSFLTDLFERCQAAPLPDPESALGVRIAVFDDLASYQREVLGAGAEG